MRARAVNFYKIANVPQNHEKEYFRTLQTQFFRILQNPLDSFIAYYILISSSCAPMMWRALSESGWSVSGGGWPTGPRHIIIP